ncbi:MULTISPECIES: CidA/LrgA family protein [unclassified Jeotgalibaca]|uniref:CidA/LrgA family protein n=1 Tax=unclassified Jeotgalibaca TaxID=2621505 RepID=UPI003FCF06B2
MKIFKQLFWILLFSFIGEFISALLPFPIPGSVIGMILLFIVLHYGWLKMEQVEEVGNWLTSNMALFFVPAGVALMTNFDLLADYWWQLLVITFITTIIMMVSVGKIVQFIKLKTRGDKE